MNPIQKIITNLLKKIPDLFESKRFWVVVVAIFVNYLKETLNLSPEQVEQITALLIAWIVGDSIRGTRQPVSFLGRNNVEE